MYGRQYDNMAQLHETNSMRGSVHGSGIQGSFQGQTREMYYQEEKTSKSISLSENKHVYSAFTFYFRSSVFITSKWIIL